MASSLFGNNQITPMPTRQSPQPVVTQTDDAISVVEDLLRQSGGDAKAAFYSLAKQKGVDPEGFLTQLGSKGNPMTLLQAMMAKNPRIGSLFRLFGGAK